jgi:hypothetical protein
MGGAAQLGFIDDTSLPCSFVLEAKIANQLSTRRLYREIFDEK